MPKLSRKQKPRLMAHPLRKANSEYWSATGSLPSPPPGSKNEHSKLEGAKGASSVTKMSDTHMLDTLRVKITNNRILTTSCEPFYPALLRKVETHSKTHTNTL